MKTVFLDFSSLHPADLDTAALQTADNRITLWDDTDPEQLAERLATAEVAVVNKLSLGAAEFAAAPRLQLVCLAATGADNIDLDAARDHGIAVCNIRNYCTPAVVQHVFALILALTQQLPGYQQQVSAGAWQRSRHFCLLEPTIRELAGCTLGVIGYGTLGQAVASAAVGFGLQPITAATPWREQAPADIPRLPLETLLNTADIVSLHCPLTPDTEQLINASRLQLMRPDALLINTARGGLVDSAALLEALESKQLGGAGIDVLSEEPPVHGDPLLAASLPNLIVTPHIAWSTREARQRALDAIMHNIDAFAAGRSANRLV